MSDDFELVWPVIDTASLSYPVFVKDGKVYEAFQMESGTAIPGHQIGITRPDPPPASIEADPRWMDYTTKGTP